MKEQILPRTAEKKFQGTHGYEYMVISINREDPIHDVRRRLREHSEYGKWELHRSILYMGGGRRFWMRRKIYNVTSTLSVN